jgi:hypothetical protein
MLDVARPCRAVATAAVSLLLVAGVASPNAWASYAGRNGLLFGFGSGGFASMTPAGTWLARSHAALPPLITAAPQFSADGVHIVFGGDQQTDVGLVPRIYVARWNGTKLHRLGVRGLFPTWSPSGRALYFGRGVKPLEPAVWSIHSDGTDAHRLFSLPGLEVGGPLRMSPDGHWLAFPAAPTGQSGSIWLVHRNGQGLHPLPLPEHSDLADFDWSPGGSSLIFSRTIRDASGDLISSELSINADGSGLRRIVQGVSGIYAPRGDEIFYSGTWPFQLVDATGGNPRRIPFPNGTTDSNRPTILAWQPIRTEQRSSLSVHVRRIDRWTFRVTGRVGPVSERWQRIVVVGQMGSGPNDISRHQVLTTKGGYSTWLPDDHPHKRGTCAVKVRFLGDAVSRPVTKSKRFAC